jgi:hypothetical protein
LVGIIVEEFEGGAVIAGVGAEEGDFEGDGSAGGEEEGGGSGELAIDGEGEGGGVGAEDLEAGEGEGLVAGVLDGDGDGLEGGAGEGGIEGEDVVVGRAGVFGDDEGGRLEGGGDGGGEGEGEGVGLVGIVVEELERGVIDAGGGGEELDFEGGGLAGGEGEGGRAERLAIDEEGEGGSISGEELGPVMERFCWPLLVRVTVMLAAEAPAAMGPKERALSLGVPEFSVTERTGGAIWTRRWPRLVRTMF